MDLHGKVALVTGSSRGIGRAIALELAKCGAMVGINYSKDDAGAEETLALIKKSGGYAQCFKYDVANYSSSAKLIEDVKRCFGKIDILINNAGISKVGLFMDMDEKDWDDIISVNLKGVFNTTHNVLKHMINQKCGTIINISSIWGDAGAACEVIYSASKGGINSFTKSLAKEVGPSNIRVNAIAPGVIETEMNSWLKEDERESLKAEIPMGGFGSGEDVAKLASFLCSDNAKYITGQILIVDGGML